MVAIRAEEQLAAIEAAAFGSPAQSDDVGQGRVALITRLIRTAQGLGADPDRDEYGRQVLIGYDAVKGWLDYWQAA